MNQRRPRGTSGRDKEISPLEGASHMRQIQAGRVSGTLTFYCVTASWRTIAFWPASSKDLPT